MLLDELTLTLPAEEGARLLALALLAEADEAAGRLEKGADDEALHDFRVALRRLRSIMRGLRPWLPSVKRRHERQLRKIANSTNQARDAEVQLEWLAGQRKALATAPQRAGYQLVVSRLEALLHGGPDATQAVARYRLVAGKLGRRLRRTVARGPSLLGGVLAKLLREQLAALQGKMAAIGGPMDQEGIHRARIEGKRLRYLLEPLRGHRGANAKEPIRHLKQAQDVLGSLHDAHVLAAELRELLIATSAEQARVQHEAISGDGTARPRARPPPNPRPGIVALTRRLREHRDALHATVEREWRAGGLDVLAKEVEAVAAALEARANVQGRLERRFLLATIPGRATHGEVVEITQGWLPGDRVRERVRRSIGRGGARYFRSVNASRDTPAETEDETTQAIFEALWPLTEGRRLSKRRHEIADGELRWKIDELIDRALVVATVELPRVMGDVKLPLWLRPHVVREITEETAYADERLANGPASQSPATASEPPPATGAARLNP